LPKLIYKMKHLLTIALLASLTMSTLNSCDSYHSLSNAQSIGQLSSNPFLQNVARSLTKNMGGMLVQNGISKFGKLGLNTNLAGLLSSAQAVSGFKNMLSSTYGISNSMIEKNYNKLNTVRDVVGLVSTAGTKGLNFYNY
jgi:hypothetical protein